MVASYGPDGDMMCMSSQAGIVPLRFPGIAETFLPARPTQFSVRLGSVTRRQGS